MLKDSLLLLKKPIILIPLLVLWTIFLVFAVANFLDETKTIVTEDLDSIFTEAINYILTLPLIIAILYVTIFLVGIAFIAGVGSILKSYPRIDRYTLKDIIYGIGNYYEKSFLIMCLFIILLIVFNVTLTTLQNGLSGIMKLLFSTPDIIKSLTSVIFKSDTNLLTIVRFLIYMLVFPLIAPLLAGWIPSIILDDMDLKEGLKRSIDIGTNNYVKMYFASLICYIPRFTYLISLASYYLLSKQQLILDNKMFYTFAFLDNTAKFLSLAILSIYAIYLFVFCNRLKEQAVQRAIREITL